MSGTLDVHAQELTDTACRAIVREHCWLVNLSGKADTFLLIDRGMEAAIKDIKVSQRQLCEQRAPNTDLSHHSSGDAPTTRYERGLAISLYPSPDHPGYPCDL